MSLTSYRAAPPRAKMRHAGVGPGQGDEIVRGTWSGLAVTYSPTP